MRRAIFVAIPLLAASAAVALASGQATQSTTERTRQLYVSVLDRKGAPAQGVTTTDLVIKEDGKVREVLEVRPAERPLHIALLVDDSEAASEATSHLREGLAAFLERMRGRASIALITMGERPTVVAPYTEDTELIRKQAARIFPRSGSGAYLLDAIMDVHTGLVKREAERPTIVAISFEGTDFSNRQYQQVLQALGRSGVTLHVVTVGSPNPSLSDEMRNRGIVIAEGTQRTGGRRDQVLTPSGIPDKLKEVADDLLHQYLVTYGRPDTLVPPDKLEVTSARADLKVRARTQLPTR